MTGPLPDPRGRITKRQVRVAVIHVTSTHCSEQVDTDIEVIGDAVREFATKLHRGEPWDVIITNEVSPGRDEAREPHDPGDLHRFWSALMNNVDVLIVHPCDNGSTALGEFVKIAIDAPGQPLVAVPRIEGIKISRAWEGQARSSTQVRFLKVEGRGLAGRFALADAITRFLSVNLDEIMAGPKRRRMIETAMLRFTTPLARWWRQAPDVVQHWLASDLKLTRQALQDIVLDPMELAAYGTFNFLSLEHSLTNPDEYVASRGTQVLGGASMAAWAAWSSAEHPTYAQRILRTAIIRRERTLAEVSTPVHLDQAGMWREFARSLDREQ